ncbi:MAG: DUF2141 domain-containing protein [Deltaproteobacteria bacterium]|nr:DUF2141 domain-containing protein [Deltaproteobacteria bacterium]
MVPAVATEDPVTQKRELEVHVKGVYSQEGDIRVGIYKKKGFPINGKELMGQVMPAKDAVKGELKVVFKGVIPGTYAVAIVHDVNRNAKTDKNFFGVPTEDYAFSKNVRGIFGPPDFEDAAFELSGNKTITIQLN